MVWHLGVREVGPGIVCIDFH